MGKYTKIDKAYDFLTTHQEFDLSELTEASSWSSKNTESNISKKLKDFFIKGTSKEYKVLPIIETYNKDDFRKIFSQTYNVKIPTKVEKLLNKSKECILTAVQNYNNPIIEYRLGSFITLSFIGFATLFHAIFERDSSVKYVKTNGDFLNLVDALNKYKGKREYNIKYEDGYLKKEVLKNIEGLRYFRNNIEHAYCELLDIDLYPLCQKVLYDYQKILVKEFGRENNVGNKLCLALQFSYQCDYSKERQNKEYKDIKERIVEHMSSTTAEYPALIPIMIPANKYKEIDLTKIDTSKYSQIIAIVQEEKRNNAKNTVAELNSFLETELRVTSVKFTSDRLLKLSRALNWRDNEKNILNSTYLGYDDLRAGNIYYKNASIEYIKEELRKSVFDIFKKVLTQSQLESFFSEN